MNCGCVMLVFDVHNCCVVVVVVVGSCGVGFGHDGADDGDGNNRESLGAVRNVALLAIRCCWACQIDADKERIIQIRVDRRLIVVLRVGASVYLEPGAADACRSESTATDCPEFPCRICPPRS